MHFIRLRTAALVQMHPYDCLRIKPPTGKTMFTKTFSLRAVLLPVALVAFAFSFAPQASAQSYAAVHGTVSDATGGSDFQPDRPT
jgi:hypothetical protein